MYTLAPDYVYTVDGLRSNLLIRISNEGYIEEIIPRDPASEISHPLPGIALLPGFVNAHSHVFQRALRGHTHRPLSQQDTFWTWRRTMYAEAQRLTPDLLYEQAVNTYREMLAAGYTSAGEFHYIHHQPDGRPYADPNVM